MKNKILDFPYEPMYIREKLKEHHKQKIERHLRYELIACVLIGFLATVGIVSLVLSLAYLIKQICL